MGLFFAINLFGTVIVDEPDQISFRFIKKYVILHTLKKVKSK